MIEKMTLLVWNLFLNSCDLKVPPLSTTHHFPNYNLSLLDLIIVCSTDHVEKHEQCTGFAFSYHDRLYLSYKIKSPKVNSKILLQRNFGAMDMKNVQEDATNIDWSVVLNANTVNEQTIIFNSLLSQLNTIATWHSCTDSMGTHKIFTNPVAYSSIEEDFGKIEYGKIEVQMQPEL